MRKVDGEFIDSMEVVGDPKELLLNDTLNCYRFRFCM
jgi:hypothetical protein